LIIRVVISIANRSSASSMAVDRPVGWGRSRHPGLTPLVVREVVSVWCCCRSCATPWWGRP